MRSRARHLRSGGWTLAELVVAMGAAVLGSLLAYSILVSGMNLFARNTAVNVSHQAARYAVERITKDIHASISIPILVSPTLQPVTNLSWAAGVSCMVPAGLPLRVNNDAAGGQNVIEVVSAGFKPAAGQRFLIPTHQVEADIASVSPLGGGAYSLTLASALPVDVKVKNSGPDYNIVAQVGTVLAYVVKFADPSRPTGELWYYPNVNDASTYSIVARDITSATPFSYPIY